MANLSQQKRKEMLAFLDTLKKQHSDDESLIAINKIEKELTSKKYGLVWEEHEEEADRMMQDTIPVFTEIEEKKIVGDPISIDYNFLIEGDNLHSLKLLEKTHKGKVDVIYIDPPYNTEKEGFTYDDKYVGTDDTYRNSKWLSFMYERLKIARKLLRNTGVIFISINDYEQAELKLLCDEVFSRENFIEEYIWESTFKPDNSSPILRRNSEFVLCYAKDRANIRYFKGSTPTTEGMASLTKSKENIKEIRFPAKTVYTTLEDGIYRKGVRNNGKKPAWELLEDVIVENGKIVSEVKLRGRSYWATEQKVLSELENGTEIWIKSNKFIPYYKKSKSSSVRPSKILSRDIVRDYGFANTDISEVFGNVPFTNSKPKTLIKFLVDFTDNKDALILDFFAGSGTTGQAVLELNQEDEGNRKFILCNSNENQICENITYRRLKTVITGTRGDGSKYSEGINSNLKYYKTDFIEKDSDELSDELLNHVKEMIQLEYGIEVDNKRYVMIMDDEEMDSFEKNIHEYTDLQAVFINQDVLLSTVQETMLSKVDTYIIPDYYFDSELREAGELW